MRMIAPLFRLGLGGRLGNGRQWMSCIEIHDLAAMVAASLRDPSLSGPVNAVMPSPVTNAAFTQAVAREAGRPALFPAPSFALRAALGDLSHLLLDSQRVVPTRLPAGFAYRFGTVEAALRNVFRGS